MKKEILIYEKGNFYADFSRKRRDKFQTDIQTLFDENGLPVNVELEVNEDGVVLTAIRRKLSDVELMEICNSVDGCESCVFQGDCDDEGGEI